MNRPPHPPRPPRSFDQFDAAHAHHDDSSVTIDCDLCEMQGTSVCDDCVVSFLCRTERQAVVIDLSEVRALRTLGDGGLVPQLRHQPTAGLPT